MGFGCAKTDCAINSQCGTKRYCDNGTCRRDCLEDFDCRNGQTCNVIGRCEAPVDGSRPPAMDGGADAGAPRVDLGRDLGPARDQGPNPTDFGPSPVDQGPPPPVDQGPAPIDQGPAPVDQGPPPPRDTGPVGGTARYLDRCTQDSDCASALCVDDVSTTRYCTQTCSSDFQCAGEQACASGRCMPDDVGKPCTVAQPASCAFGLCVGGGSGGSCTRPCGSAADCPAGYACSTVPGNPMRVCLDIEKPCTASGSECGSGLCNPALGCTATCRNDGDCPARFAVLGFPPYRCMNSGGQMICQFPSDVLGADGAGAICRDGPVFGTTLCRSGACDDGALPAPSCVQACDPASGCARGLGCRPIDAGGGQIVLACSRAGSRTLGDSCSRGSDCATSMCDTAGYCTRLCNDSYCPTGWRCEPLAGLGISICRR